MVSLGIKNLTPTKIAIRSNKSLMNLPLVSPHLNKWERVMNSVEKILEIESRLEHLEASALWIARETVHSDNAVSQTGTLITVLADEIREKLVNLIRELEDQAERYLQ